MAAHRKNTMLNGNLKNILLGLAAAGTLGTGGASVINSSHADERAAKLETKVEKLEKDRDDTAKKVERIDKRTIRMEEYLKLMGSKMGVRTPRDEE